MCPESELALRKAFSPDIFMFKWAHFPSSVKSEARVFLVHGFANINYMSNGNEGYVVYALPLFFIWVSSIFEICNHHLLLVSLSGVWIVCDKRSEIFKNVWDFEGSSL